MRPEFSFIRSSWFHFVFSVGFKNGNTKSLFTALKLGSFKWFRAGIWDICSWFDWHLLELTWRFLRKINRLAWSKKYWNINNLKVALDLGHIFSFGRNNFLPERIMGIVFCLKKTLVLWKKLEEVNFFKKRAAITYLNVLTDSWLVRITNEL